ncbi:MAG: DNA alkylation repair protein [Lachnospiraceae bacterium]|nr:DNA alkylation repair protein [Lachnospiraceae bacterium]MBD5481766.1 DNA alkylation repair protein [Lachnospiraceae bacterium]
MNQIVEDAVRKIQELNQQVPEGKHIITGDIRRLSAKLFRQIPDRDIAAVFSLCEDLLEQHDWALGVIAFDWAYRMKSQYSESTYDIFYRWLKKYVRGWGDCDDFCTHAFGELLRQYPSLFPKITEWTKDGDFWVRRASAVILIPSILRDDYKELSPFIISDALMSDEHDLVQKGYGWMLKSLSQIDMPSVKKYLIANHGNMPRTAYRYALEKFDKKTRDELMSL